MSSAAGIGPQRVLPTGVVLPFAASDREIARDYLKAREAGLEPPAAYRWGLYLQLKQHRHERPISLAEAVAQKRAALAAAGVAS